MSCRIGHDMYGLCWVDWMHLWSFTVILLNDGFVSYLLYLFLFGYLS